MGNNKQVKVDNWGIFFLQRLNSYFKNSHYCDLTLKFENNVELKVHRLVLNTCTEYFQILEKNCEVVDDCLTMPADIQIDVILPIINFMYTGILEYENSVFDQLQEAAKLMNMSVLTKLLEAQKKPIAPITKPIDKKGPINPVTWNLQGKKISPKIKDPDLPETLPGRKLPIWKRKCLPSVFPYRNEIQSSITENKFYRSSIDDVPKPTRFEWPEDDEPNFPTDSFDEISYTSKPLFPVTKDKYSKPSTSNFEELKRTSVSSKRSGSPLFNDNKKVNIEDMKDYIKEQRIRSGFIDCDDAEAADNDLQSFDNSDEETGKSLNKSTLKNCPNSMSNKKVRFSLEEKENAADKSTSENSDKTSVNSNMDHKKLITEVLKKFPHLVKKNKNIKLKILTKGTTIVEGSPSGIPTKNVKSPTKVSYKVDANIAGEDNKCEKTYTCQHCDDPLIFESYYLYRKHLTDVHNEKTDSQMCSDCGHVSRKQNMLMYHKYVKHNIVPPPSYNFPKCNDCAYVALSPALLVKHQLNHTHQNLVCGECNSAFPTKSLLISHMQITGHTKAACPTHNCGYCTKKFISNETLLLHIKKNHAKDAIRDNIISETDIEDMENKQKKTINEETKTNTLNVDKSNSFSSERPKEKIKILSDVKVSTSFLSQNKIQVNTQDPNSKPEIEQSSEAESLSKVASGIAASLGIVNTIVVLDENQYILQENNQANTITEAPQNFILPNISNFVTQDQEIANENTPIISQATLDKNNIASTDELVMVLTDHDYSDAANNSMLTPNNSNIVVLYSHPVQNQDNQFITQQMITSDMGLMQVNNDFADTNPILNEKACEESIEMIQQEINKNVEKEITDIISPTQAEKIDDVNLEAIPISNELEQQNNTVSEDLAKMDKDKSEKQIEPVNKIAQPSITVLREENATFEEVETASKEQNSLDEPMEVEESIEMIQQEIDKNETVENKTDDVGEEKSTVIALDEKIIENDSVKKITDSNKKNNLQTTIKPSNDVESNIEQTLEKVKDELMEVDSGKLVNVECQLSEQQLLTNSLNEKKEATDTIDIIKNEIEKIEDKMDESKNEINDISYKMENFDNEIKEITDEINKITDRIEINVDKITESAHSVSEDEIKNIKNEELENVNISVVNSEETKEAPNLKQELLPNNPKILNILDEWDDGDTDSQSSNNVSNVRSENKEAINTLINDWDDEEL